MLLVALHLPLSVVHRQIKLLVELPIEARKVVECLQQSLSPRFFNLFEISFAIVRRQNLSDWQPDLRDSSDHQGRLLYLSIVVHLLTHCHDRLLDPPTFVQLTRHHE